MSPDDNPKEQREIEYEGNVFYAEIYGREQSRCLIYGPKPSRILFTSFDTPHDHMRRVNWTMVEKTLRHTWDTPKLGRTHSDKFYGEDGIFMKGEFAL